LSKAHRYDVLIIGSGAAGLSLALKLPPELQIAVLSKADLAAGSTAWAQGGMAAVLHDRDSVAAHEEDTLVAGAGLCHRPAVQFTVENGPEAVQWLVEQGVSFDRRDDQPDTEFREFHLTMEGGHSHRRILHAADRTGRAIADVLGERARAADNITLLTDRCGIDLILRENRVVGAYILNTHTGDVDTFYCSAAVLATGGASKAYLYTSNPDGASGDGIAMAWRAGCRVANLEFNQFHPTCLYHPGAKSFLVTEALRGEGARLELPSGEAFMTRYHPRGDLAPRDIVARAIDEEMKRNGLECVYLNITHRSAEFLQNHFPTVLGRCAEFGIDITQQRIPVVPAAHYTCGGVVVDQHGATDVAGLYVIGETACTGLHGANRMASNSLLECFVYASAAAKHIGGSLAEQYVSPLPDWDPRGATPSDQKVVVQHNWQELRRLMWDYVGIVRSDKRLDYAARRIQLMAPEIDDYYHRFEVSRPMLELRNLCQVAELMVACALGRKESRGLHFNSDHPASSDPPRNSILRPGNSPLEEYSDWQHLPDYAS
jgi:L-aspartate oxidase